MGQEFLVRSIDSPQIVEPPSLISEDTPTSTSWSDNFDDGDYSGWTVTRGGYLVANNLLRGTTLTWNYIEHLSSAVTGTWSFDYNFYGGEDGIWQPVDGGLAIWFIANGHQSTDPTQAESGYFVLFHPHDDAIELWMDPGDEGYNRVLLGSWSPQNFVKSWHVDITRDSDGVFNIYLDGVNRIQATDTTYFTSYFFGFLGYNQQEMDNVVVQNLVITPPSIDAILAPSDPHPVGTVVTATATFADSGIDDTHHAAWDWGDGSTSEMYLEYGDRSLSADHLYDSTGVYTISLTIIDNDGGFGIAQFMYIVIYDPEGEFITGGGWFTSPIGAYTAEPSLTGNARFGFLAKYKKGADIPMGQTTFVFQLADLNFHGTEYDWLVVAGARAMFKGHGTINGQGDYGFLITAIDGQINGGGDVDKFRIKIWDKATGEIIYDNELGTDETTYPITAIEGGSIVIHRDKY
jgi:hypothetical protein